MTTVTFIKTVVVVLLVGLGIALLDVDSKVNQPPSSITLEYSSAISQAAREMELVSLRNNHTELKAEVAELKAASGHNNNSDLLAEVTRLRSELKKAKKGGKRKPKKGAPKKANQDLAHPEWCPKASCHNTALCKPCQHRFLIVITHPRCASTTLTWMLDSLPGVTMSGENNDALGALRSMEAGIMEKENMLQPQNNNNDDNSHTAWSHHKFVQQSFGCVHQKFIRHLNPPFLNDNGEFENPEMEATEIVGFKTVRFFNNIIDGQEELKTAANWLTTNFPCARVIINANTDVEAEAKSIKSTFKTMKGKPMEDVLQRVARGLELSKELYEILGPERAYFLDKSQWVGSDMKYINDAVEWLGFHESCKFERLLEFNVGGDGFGKGVTEANHPDTCRPL